MRMLVCDKCKFVMVNSHELYNGVIVMVSAKHSQYVPVPTTIRGFSTEWPGPNRTQPVPGPDRQVPTIFEPEKTNVITKGPLNMMKVFWRASLAKAYNNQPYREEGDKDVRDFFEEEPFVAGLTPNTEVPMDHKNLGLPSK